MMDCARLEAEQLC